MLKLLYILLALVSLMLGGIGIVLPGLPTTPFVLLAAALLFRASDTLYQRLLRNRIFGKYIKRYRERKGMSLRAKTINLILMWVMISLSVYRIEDRLFRIPVVLLGITGTLVILFFIRTVEE